jgi:hypothetical protein
LVYVENVVNFEIKGRHKDYCGIFGFPNASFCCHYGLAYGSKEHYPLPFGYGSTSNYIIGDRGGLIDIQGEGVVVSPGIFQHQKVLEDGDYIEELAQIVKEQRWVLLEVSIEDLFYVRQVRRSIKSFLKKQSSTEQRESEILYISTNKMDVYSSVSNHQKKVLVSMSKYKFRRFQKFRSHSGLEHNNDAAIQFDDLKALYPLSR